MGYARQKRQNNRTNLRRHPARKPQQREMKLLPAGRGGWRPGAGRKPQPGARVLHRTRGNVPGDCPVHVTVRVRRGIPSLRQRRFVSAFKRSLSEGCARRGFRVVHYSIQSNHLHFLIEAQGKEALGRGMKSLSARIGRCVNRVFERSGSVLNGRYHRRILKTPREVRHALAYVLLNARHHFHQRHRRPPPGVRLDPASSSPWFDGWKRSRPPSAESHPPSADQSPPLALAPPRGPSLLRATASTRSKPPREVATASTWLLRNGWRRHRLIDPAEVPG